MPHPFSELPASPARLSPETALCVVTLAVAGLLPLLPILFGPFFAGWL
ncbi:hypothetical protein H2509_13920 [Stappia sp. F7233]|uniref:Uncharacterized protein n=1 Tax=Stappia albiluteola TaxID=2758565 RepID=A0A839AF31_9HYPH|nr:hypothetical protein [Stappia albiluteola]MBA5778221.1 hypothetical protein [Stappia albiluteola]